MTIIRWPRHIKLKCLPGLARCAEDRCMNCVLFTCATCGASEGELPKDCPGEKMTQAQRDAVMAGRLEYTARYGWVALGLPGPQSTKPVQDG